MNKVIYFLRSAPYNYLIHGQNLYHSFDLVAKKIVDPPLKSGARKYFDRNVPKGVYRSNQVYTSKDQRAIQTGQFVNGNTKTLNLLKEVRYSMSNFISEQDFYGLDNKPQTDKARKAFVSALVGNHLEEGYNNLFKRIKILIKYISKEDFESVTIITHGFLLKIIEAYLRDPEVAKNPVRLLSYFSGESQTFSFCEGFVATQSQFSIRFKRYIRNKKGGIIKL